MNKIVAIIKSEKLEGVRCALEKIGCFDLIINEITEHVNQKGIAQEWRKKTSGANILSKTKIEITIKDSEIERIIKTIVKSAEIGEVGDDKIFIHTIDKLQEGILTKKGCAI